MGTSSHGSGSARATSSAAAASSRAGTPRAGVLVTGMVALWLCWGTSFPAMRIMVATLPPLLASGAIFTVAGLVLAATRPRALRGVTRQQAATAAGVGICLLVAQGLVAVAVQHVYASTAALLVAVIPLWVAVLGSVTGDRPNRATLRRLALGFAGVAIVLLAPGDGVAWSWWATVVVAAAISWAAGTLWASRTPHLPATRAATVVQLAVGGLVLLAAGLLVGEAGALTDGALTNSHVTAVSWGAFAYLVLVDSLAGLALFNLLLRTAPVSLVSTYAYAVPVVAYLVGVLALGEPFHPLVLLGAAAIVTAVATEVRARGRP